MNRIRKVILLLMLCTLLAAMLAGCGSGEDKAIETLEDMEQGRIGVLTGSSFDTLAKEYFPEAERVYFMNITDLVLNLKQGKIDGILMDKGYYTPLNWQEKGLSCIDMEMPATQYAVAFSQTGTSDRLKKEVNEYIHKCKESGKLEELENKWFSETETDYIPDLSKLTGENGTLRVATTAEIKPFCYIKEGKSTGFDIELLTGFAEEYGYALDFDTMDFGAILPSLAADRYDLAIASITVTEERKESVDFSEIYYNSPIVMAVLGETSAEDGELVPADFAEATIGVVTGSSHDKTTRREFPDAERVYFSRVADMVLAVEQGKIDCYIEDEPFLAGVIWEGANVTKVNEPVSSVKNGFAFPQSEDSRALREQMNEFIAQAKADGTIDSLKEKWLGDAEPTEHPDYLSLTGENGTIKLAVVVDSKPVIYLHEEQCTGLEIELLTMFGQKYGYKYDIEMVPFDSIIAGLSAGRYDIGASSLNITPEREENVDFSDPYTEYNVYLVVKGDGDADKRQRITELSQLENGTIGIMTGSFYDSVAKEKFPNAERNYYSMHSDMIVSMEQGKIDAIFEDEIIYTTMLWEKSPVVALEEPVAENNMGMIFAKDADNQELQDQINAFIAKSLEDGTIDGLKEKWFADTEPTEHPDYTGLTGENGTLKVAVGTSIRPMAYLKGDTYTGFEVEFLTKFAKENGYKLEIEGMTFEALIPAVSSGKFDLGASSITITPERAQSVDFSDSYVSANGVAIVYAGETAAAEIGMFDGISESFEKTFIRENRWKLILKGVGVTLLISICAAVAGTMLGFGLYMLVRCDIKPLRRVAELVARVYSRIVEGTPVVVVLMVLFYVVFGSFRDISGVLVAIIGFTLTFGAFVYDHMKVSVNSVDRGQTEAAYALGYTKNKTFFRIIFPQAMSVFMPTYCGQMVELVKATAVVGYIAVNDLTKMGDIIRSNTYEAFFPLITTAAIYFLITWLLSLLLKRVKFKFEPKRRSKEDILKGVKTE